MFDNLERVTKGFSLLFVRPFGLTGSNPFYRRIELR